MNEVFNSKGILYRVEKDFPIDGVNFIDLTPSLIEKDYFKKIANSIKEMILQKNKDIDYIVSPDARGFLWGTYVAALLDRPLIPVRKHGKLPSSCVMTTVEDTTEYSSIKLDIPIVDLKNKRCIFIDDVYATGGTYKACKKLIELNGGTIDDPYVVLNVVLTDDVVNALITSDNLKID